jgi:class 3 adenylate cyclase/WD40 repeat protein/energy-coupling factor transporter ATP-binding protein EcfA2
MASPNGGSARAAAIRTFLIADVRGYTRFTAQHGDEAASRLATKFAEIAHEGVEAWGGELVELRGDEALAAFDSLRGALRAAVELQSAFADETASEPELPLLVGIGLDIGEAVPVGDGYRGAALNLAARLCAVAGPGEVLASEGLTRLAGRVEGLQLTSLEPTTVKGYDEPIAAVRVEGSGAARRPAAVGSAPASSPPPLPPELDPTVPLAGREAELRWLAWHWRRARHGHGRSLVLSGPPGIGKTRLAAELATIAHAGGATVAYHQAPRETSAPDVEALAGMPEPALVVIDDLDAAATTIAPDLERLAQAMAGQAGLLLVTHRREAPPTMIALAEGVAPPEQRRALGPLEPAAVREIATLYAGRAVADLALEELVARSGGVPAAVHQVASQWARTAASRRLEASADRTGAGRRSLRDAEAAMIEDVADLETAREHARRYELDRGDADERARIRMVCPYKGLAAFEATDADYYFGRERLIAELITRFVGGSFLGLVGDSGCGKSSALRAGLLPALAGGVLPGSETWPQAVMRPGEHPLAELGRALARALPDRTLPTDDPSAALDAALAGLAAGQRLVVVVDQFEEVFNATRDDAERSAFIDLLTGARPGLKVIVAIRADHYGRCAAYPALARLLGSDQVLVGPLSGAELAAVIEHPAQRVGLRVEPALTEALVADAGTEPGVLPLLSTCLLELWGARDAGRLTLAAYRASGGLQGAIARLAEATYAELDPHRQSVARALLLRLAGPGEGAELVRRRVPLSELDADRDPAVAEVLETLTDARLLTAGEGHVEVAHEALLREWPRLQGWLEEDAAGRQVRLHLIGAVADWESRGREPGDLYRGARLATALEWAADHGVELNAAERTFLDESRQASEREVERQRRMVRRLRVLLAGTAALLVVAVAAGGFAVLQSQRATDEAQRAEQQRLLAQQAADNATQQQQLARSRELLASALAAVSQDASLAKLLAVEAMRGVSTPSSQATGVLHRVLAADPIVARYSWPKDRHVDVLSTNLDPSGRLLVASGDQDGSPTNYLEVAEATTGKVLWSWSHGDASATSADGVIGPAWFSADGTQVIAGLYWASDAAPPSGVALGVAFWDAHTGRYQKTIDLGPCGARVTAVAKGRLLAWTPEPGPDGRTGCHWPADGQQRVEAVDLATGAVTRLSDRASIVWGGTLSGDGRFAGFDVIDAGPCGTAGCDKTVVVELATGKRVFQIAFEETSNLGHFARQLNYDGTLLLSNDRPTQVYRIADGPGAKPIAQWAGTGGGAAWSGGTAVFDPTGQAVFQTSRDGTLRRWDPMTGAVLDTWSAIGSGRISVSADGRTVLVSDPLTTTAAVLDVGARGDLGGVVSCRSFTTGGSLKVSGDLAVFGEICPDGSIVVQVVDLQRRAILASWPGWFTQDVVVSPDGRFFVSQESKDGVEETGLAVADLRTGAPVVELQGMCRYDSSSPPFDQQPGCVAYPKTPFPYQIGYMSTRWSPDGTMIASVDANTGAVIVWDARTGAVRFLGDRPSDRGAVAVMFTPDSKGLVVSWTTGVVETLSTETWKPVTTATLDPSVFGVDSLGLLGFTPDGSTILAVGGFGGDGDATLIWLDAATLKVTKTVAHAHQGSPKSMALSPDGSLMATGASDGILRIWDTKTGELRQQMDFKAEVQGLAFIDDRHLAVTPQGGDLLIMTIDPAELANVLRASLTRTFTATECTTYAIDPCPTLEQMRGGN